MTQELREIVDGMTPKMRSALMTGSATGYTCIGKMVTLKALKRRGLIAPDHRWTTRGWATVLWIAANEPGWNLAHFPTLADTHAAALLENQGPEIQHNATDEYACTECGHRGNGQVPGCTCIGCDDGFC